MFDFSCEVNYIRHQGASIRQGMGGDQKENLKDKPCPCEGVSPVIFRALLAKQMHRENTLCCGKARTEMGMSWLLRLKASQWSGSHSISSTDCKSMD